MFSNKRKEIKRGIKALAKTVSVVISQLSCDDRLQKHNGIGMKCFFLSLYNGSGWVFRPVATLFHAVIQKPRLTETLLFLAHGF